jgi:hypothetical protein
MQGSVWGDRFLRSSQSLRDFIGGSVRMRLSFHGGEQPDHWEEFDWREEATMKGKALLKVLRD